MSRRSTTMPPSDDSAPGQTLIPLRLVRVVLRERSDQQWIFLTEDDPDKAGNERGFPIVIGTGEASEIHRLVTGVTPPRPLTHQLTVSAVEALGSRVLGVDIVDLRSNTFFAQLRLAAPGADALLEGSSDGEVLVDARPSDALALALRSGAPIRVAETVLEQVRSDKSQDVLPEGDESAEEAPDGDDGSDSDPAGGDSSGDESSDGPGGDPDSDADFHFDE